MGNSKADPGTDISDIRLKRFGWIEACLRYAGAFGTNERASYAQMMTMSVSTASRDADAFVEAANALCGEDVVIKEARRLVVHPDRQLPASGKLFEVPEIRLWLPQFMKGGYEKIRTIERADPSAGVMASVVSAILEKRTLQIQYHSRGKGAGLRTISPHTIVDVAGRFHVRAFFHDKNDYGDFVLARISSCLVVSKPKYVDKGGEIGKPGDVEWHRKEIIDIHCADDVAKEGVRIDFGLDEMGRKTRRVRCALVDYVIDKPKDGYASPVIVKRRFM